MQCFVFVFFFSQNFPSVCSFLVRIESIFLMNVSLMEKNRMFFGSKRKRRYFRSFSAVQYFSTEIVCFVIEAFVIIL